MVFLPPYGSWLTWIEAASTALRYFALSGTDHRSHDGQNATIGAYVRRRTTHAKPKTNLAPDPTIRTRTHHLAKPT